MSQRASLGTVQASHSNSPAPADLPVVPNFIGGKLSRSSSEQFGNIYDPAIGRVIGNVVYSSARDVDLAVSAAKAAFGQ